LKDLTKQQSFKILKKIKKLKKLIWPSKNIMKSTKRTTIGGK
jgi:hypothetical protein